ncbi:MAG: hypothetical protein MI919_09530, partial [Holophagales bacterium]|nr:hypothetical protein [Holophagales bacterium]
MGKKGSKTAEAAEIENGGWLVPAWRRVHLLGFPDTVSARMQALMETVVEGAGVEAAEPSFFEHPERLARGDLLLLSQQLAPRLQALEWLATLRKAGHDTPAIVLVAGDPFPPPPELAPVDILASKGLGAHDLARSLGYLRRGLEDSFLADEILKRLRAFGEIRAGDDEHTRAMELAGAYRNQLEEREDELHHARARIAELEAALAGLEPRERSQQDGGSPARGDPAFLARRVRRLEAELEQSEGLRRGQEAAIVELRRRLGEGDDASLPGGVTELTSRLMVSEWMRTAQMQNIQYLHQRLDTLDSCFKALGVLLQTPEGTAELDPAALLE